MNTLYELTSEYTCLMGALDYAQTDEEINSLYEAIINVDGSIADKADAYARILRNKQAEAEMYKAEKQRLEAKQKAAESTVEWLKRQMLASMTQTDTVEIPTSIGKWRRQLNNPSVVIEDEAAIPAEFRVPQPDKIDKAAILKRYKDTGEAVDGATVVRTEGVRFR